MNEVGVEMSVIYNDNGELPCAVQQEVEISVCAGSCWNHKAQSSFMILWNLIRSSAAWYCTVSGLQSSVRLRRQLSCLPGTLTNAVGWLCH